MEKLTQALLANTMAQKQNPETRRHIMTRFMFIIILLVLVSPAFAQTDDYLGCWGCSDFDPNSLNNPFGAGSPYAPNSPNNPFGRYGSPFSPDGATNPFTNGGANIYNQDGEFRGKLNANRFDPNSIANPFGRYGSPFSPVSPNNPYSTDRYYNVFGN